LPPDLQILSVAQLSENVEIGLATIRPEPPEALE
jgi:hypothetical protein